LICVFFHRASFLHMLCFNAFHYFFLVGESFHNWRQNNRTVDWFSHIMGTTGYTSKRPIYGQLRMECEPIQINSMILIAFSLGCNTIFLKTYNPGQKCWDISAADICLPFPCPPCQCWWKSWKNKQTKAKENNGFRIAFFQELKMTKG